MNLALELHLVAGLGTLGLGTGAFFSAPRRARNRIFGLLCAALATWNLGVVGWYLQAPSVTRPWTAIYLLGACAAAPLALQFVFHFRRTSPRILRAALAAAYGIAGALWLSSWTPLHAIQPYWNLAAAASLGGILGAALILLGVHTVSLPKGPERSANRLLLGGALVAVIGGLSDFIPRDEQRVPYIGPAAVVVFLIFVCGIMVRHRFLDVTVFLARVLAVLAGTVVSGLFFYAVVSLTGIRLLPILLAGGIVVLLSRPAWRFFEANSGMLFSGGNPVTRGLIQVSRSLTQAQDRAAMMHAVREGRRLLPDGVELAFYLRRAADEAFHIAYKVASKPMPAAIEPSTPLTLFVEKERTPITRRFLEDEVEETGGVRRTLAQAALEQMKQLRADLIVPVFHGKTLTGCLSLGGDVDPRFLTAELADTFLAVSNQAMESLERIEALERAQQREALAAVGEMAAGLAHEIRNPVSAIRGAAQLIQEEAGEGNPGPRIREMLEVVQEETTRLGRVVSDFLEYANPRVRIRRAVEISEELRRALRAAEAAGMGLAGEISVDPATPRVMADAEQLQRIFRNLIWNAREAAGPDGMLNVDIGPDGNGRVSIRFEDDGDGIRPAELHRLFQPFHTTKPHGTGLGLALVHRLVEAHAGEIRVDGRPGLGAVFTILLPTGAAS